MFCYVLGSLSRGRAHWGSRRQSGRESQGEADGSPLCLSTFVNQQWKGWRNKVGVSQDVWVWRLSLPPSSTATRWFHPLKQGNNWCKLSVLIMVRWKVSKCVCRNPTCVQKSAYEFQDTFSEGFYPNKCSPWEAGSLPKWSDEPLYVLEKINIGWGGNRECERASLQDGGEWCELGEQVGVG